MEHRRGRDQRSTRQQRADRDPADRDGQRQPVGATDQGIVEQGSPPAARARVTSSPISRDLPTPASPPTTSVTGSPASARWSAWSMAANSVSRPTRTGLTMLLPTGRNLTARPGASQGNKKGPARFERAGPMSSGISASRAAGGSQPELADQKVRKVRKVR